MWAGSKTRPIGGETLAGETAGLSVFDAPISALASVGGGDTHREPFRYRHLCYDEARPPKPSAEEESQADNQIVTVAMLQMAPAPLSDDSEALNAQKAERFARQAKAKGADIVVMPEQWLVGTWNAVGATLGSII